MSCVTDKQIEFTIIDSHIHLYAESHLADLSWAPSLPDGHVLKRQNSVDEYRAASRSQPNLIGFVFVETDRKWSLSEAGWTHPVEEVEFLHRIRSGAASAAEGFSSDDRKLLLGAVPWAPLPTTRQSLQSYLERVNAKADLETKHGLIRGFRYLLQDKPKGHMAETEMHKGLLTLEDGGCKTFDLGVDFRQGGLWQLTEAVEMLQRFAAKSTGKLKIVINHLCKPNLQQASQDAQQRDRRAWEHAVRALADLPTTYMKLSGLFSELPPQDEASPTPIAELVERTRFEMDVIFDNFGPENIMFGSDWPVCNAGGPGPEKSWSHWVQYVAAVLDDRGLSDTAKRRVWAGTANEVYDLGIILDGSTE